MATLFVSHASADDLHATALEGWLRDRGFIDLFVDHSSIAGGDKWAQALRDSAAACRVVVCFVTERWLASDECFAEFRAAWYSPEGVHINRLLVLALLEPARPIPASPVVERIKRRRGRTGMTTIALWQPTMSVPCCHSHSPSPRWAVSIASRATATMRPDPAH